MTMKEMSPEDIILMRNRESLRRCLYMYVKDINRLMYEKVINQDITKEQPLSAGLLMRLTDGKEFRVVLTVERMV